MSDEEWDLKAQGDGSDDSKDDDEETPLPPTPKTKTRKRKRTTLENTSLPPPPSGMIPESLMNHVLTNLRQGDENAVRETLLRLARVFREQSALCLQQAQRLDNMAVEHEQGDGLIENITNDSYSTRLHRQNVHFFVGKSADMMIDCQEKLDSIESRLVPWGQKIDKSKKPGGKREVAAYTLFTTDNYDAIAKRLGTRKVSVVSSEVSKAWKALPEEEKEVYLERAREVNKQRKDNCNLQDEES